MLAAIWPAVCQPCGRRTERGRKALVGALLDLGHVAVRATVGHRLAPAISAIAAAPRHSRRRGLEIGQVGQSLIDQLVECGSP